MLTPLLASALAPESDSAICRGFSQDHRYLIYGFAAGLYPMMIFFGAPILGQLSDRVGRKTILQVCATGIVLAYVTISTAFALGSVLLLMVGRVLGGATGGSRAISMAALADVCSPREQGLLAEHGAARIVGRLCDWFGAERVARQQPNRVLVYHSHAASCHRASRQLGFRAAFVVISGVSETSLCARRRSRWPAGFSAWSPRFATVACEKFPGFSCFSRWAEAHTSFSSLISSWIRSM